MLRFPRLWIPVAVTLALLSGARVSPAAVNQEARRLEDARAVFQEIGKMPDARVPDALLRRCQGIAIVPGMTKGALGWGGRLGRGVVVARQPDGRWSPPSFITLTGGSFGLQAGVQRSDVVLFFMSERGLRSFVESEFTLGANGGVAAGPVGRSAEAGTDLKLDAEIYSYSRSKGLFAGLSLEGARVNPDRNAIRRFYGQTLTPKAILFGPQPADVPTAAQDLMAVLP